MKYIFAALSIGFCAFSYYYQSQGKPIPLVPPLSTTTMAFEPESDVYPRVRAPRTPSLAEQPIVPTPTPTATPASTASAPSTAPAPTVDQIANAVGKKTESLLVPVVERVNKLSGRVELIEELIAKLTDATRLTETVSARTLADHREELNKLKSSVKELKDALRRESGPDPVVAQLSKTIDALADTVGKINRRIEDLKSPPTSPIQEAKPESKTEPKPASRTVWSNYRLPCGYVLETAESGSNYQCPRCRRVTTIP